MYVNRHIDKFKEVSKNYECMHQVCTPVRLNDTTIVGRDIKELSSSLKNVMKPNVVLLGEPGVGKSAYVEAFAKSEYGKNYLTLALDVELFMTDPLGNKDAQVANGFISLFKEVKQYCIDNSVLVVLFIDEFHKVMKLSSASMQTIKPILEQAGYYGFKFIVATTFEEYNEFVSRDRALDERFTRINLKELDKPHVLKILENVTKQYNVNQFLDPNILEDIYNLSKQILPSRSQPRASIDILTVMIGSIIKDELMVNGKVVRTYYTPEELEINSQYLLSRPILQRVFYRIVNIDIDNNIDIYEVENKLYERLLGQDLAIKQVLGGINNVIVGFSSTKKPLFSFLSTGSTGVGKTELANLLCESLGLPMVRFDMSGYPDKTDAVRFSNELSLLAWSKPNAFILIDEIEKASKEVVNILLQVLSAARLTMANNPNNVASFVGCIINITTNVASDIFNKYKDFSDKNSKINTRLIEEALVKDKRFAPEIIGRVDKIIPFLPLHDEVMEMIAGIELNENLEKIETKTKKVHVSEEVLQFVVRDKLSTSTNSGGARDAKRQIYSIVLNEVSYHLTHNRDCKNSLLVYVDGRPRFKNKEVVNIDSGWIMVKECYNKIDVANALKVASAKLNKNIIDKGLILPTDKELKEYIVEIIRLFSLPQNRGMSSIKSVCSGKHCDMVVC